MTAHTHISEFPGLADFSEALMRANRNNQQTEPASSEQAYTSYQKNRRCNTGSMNRNISNVIAQIRDDGPAEFSKENRSGRRHPGTEALDDDVVEISAPQASMHTPENATDLLELEMKLAHSAEASRSVSWMQMLLIVLMTIMGIMGFAVYKLLEETSDLRAAIESQEAAASVQVQPKQVEPQSNEQIEHLAGSLQTLNSQIDSVRSQQQQLQDLVTAIIPDDFEQKLGQLSDMDGTVQALQSRLAGIQQTLQIMKTAPVIDIQKPPVNKPVAKLITPQASPEKSSEKNSGSDTPPDNWIVYLASLNDRQKAQTVFNKLQGAGIAPMLEEAVVKGERVYRLTVSGFTSYDSAKQFMSKAKTKLGFKGVWTRRT